MAEKVILDPSELATGRTEIDITPWISSDGTDWGDAEISAYMAEASRGEVPVDYRVPNRQIGAGLVFSRTIGGTTTVAARAAIQSKVALIQREGGWLKRVTDSGGTVFTDLTNASFRATSIPGVASRRGYDAEASISLEAIPEFYEAETTDSDNVTTTARELRYTTVLTAQGDQPMRCRIVVDNDGSTDWRGLIWAFRAKNYPGSTAATANTGSASMVYEAESLGTLDTATKTAGTAIYGTVTNGLWSGGTIVHHGTLSTSWTPVLSGRIGGTTYPTHTGTYQVFGRVASTSGTTVRTRCVWDVGDLVNPTENAWVRLAGGGTTTATVPYIVDYGEVRLDSSGLGTYRWDWQIQGAGDAGGETLSVDKVWIVNKDEGMGRLTAPITIPQGLATYSARSEFTTESGAITGDSLAVGGAWTVVTNSDSSDFTVSGGVCTRTDVSDTGTGAGVFVGRGITASTTNYTNVAASLDGSMSVVNSGVSRWALVLRVVDSSNYLLVGVQPADAFGSCRLTIIRYISGSSNNLASSTPITLQASTYYTIRGLVLANGMFSAQLCAQGSISPLVAVAGYDSSLVTGGTLASGRTGFADLNSSATAATRNYKNFAAWVPTNDAVAFNGQSAQLTTDGILREDSGGTAYGPVSSVVGDLPRFPVPPQSGGTVEALLVPSTSDLDQIPDTLGTASISAQNVRRPSWLFVDDS